MLRSSLFRLIKYPCTFQKGKNTHLFSSVRLMSSTTTDDKNNEVATFSKFLKNHKRPGTETWHEELTVPGSSGRTFKWPAYNERVFPPENSSRTPSRLRPAYICHMRALVRYTPWKMWYIAQMVRGLSVEEAIKQLSFVGKKGAVIAKEVIEEAQELAVKEHNVEFRTNLWVAESFCNRAQIIKGVRRHARGRMGTVHYYYCNYFVRLEEGKPPKDYYEWKKKKTPEEFLEEYIKEHRKKIVHQDHP